MQVLKKISLVFILVLLWGCNNSINDNRIEISDKQYDIIDYDTINQTMKNEQTLSVGVLLPLSGKYASIGQGMQNSMFMALEDLENNNMTLTFYDTKGTASGAIMATEHALSEGNKLLLGPLTSEEVRGMAEIALSKNVPVISFTTSPQVLKKGIYSMGLLITEQIERSISYAASQGRRKLALLVPDDNSGLNIVKAALMSSINNNVSLVKVGFYSPNTVDFSTLAKQMSTPRDFDMILIADSGNRLKSMVSQFAYNDVFYPDVLFIGTSAWDNTNLSKETMLYHSVYPMFAKDYGAYFTKKYKDTFGQYPNNIYAYAYDGVLLASGLSNKDRSSLNEAISRKNGFIGVNGYFKILETGQSVHNLEMFEVTQEGPKVKEKSKTKGTIVDNDIDIRYIPYEKLPKIYGKSNSDVITWLYNN